MSRDVTGQCRVNMFEQIKSPSGKVFAPVSRVGGRVTYRDVSSGETFTAQTDRRVDGMTLEYMQQEQPFYL